MGSAPYMFTKEYVSALSSVTMFIIKKYTFMVASTCARNKQPVFTQIMLLLFSSLLDSKQRPHLIAQLEYSDLWIPLLVYVALSNDESNVNILFLIQLHRQQVCWANNSLEWSHQSLKLKLCYYELQVELHLIEVQNNYWNFDAQFGTQYIYLRYV